MIEVFKTNVQNVTQAMEVSNFLQNNFVEVSINFDLADCDRILRVQGINETHPQLIISDLNSLGYLCEILY